MANILSIGNIAILSYNDRIEIYKYKEDKENEQLNQFLQFLNLLIMTEPYIKYYMLLITNYLNPQTTSQKRIMNIGVLGRRIEGLLS